MRTVKQFQDAEERGAVHTIGRVTNLPVERLRKALERASTPLVQRVEPVMPGADGDGAEPPLLRVTGRNLVRNGAFPQVRIGDRPVSILKSAPDELLLAPDDDQWAGELSLRVRADAVDRDELRPRCLPPDARAGGAGPDSPSVDRTARDARHPTALPRYRGDAAMTIRQLATPWAAPGDRQYSLPTSLMVKLALGEAPEHVPAVRDVVRGAQPAATSIDGGAIDRIIGEKAGGVSRGEAVHAAGGPHRPGCGHIGYDSVEQATGVARTLILRVPSGTPVGPLCETLAQIPTVESASPNYISVTPFDMPLRSGDRAEGRRRLGGAADGAHARGARGRARRRRRGRRPRRQRDQQGPCRVRAHLPRRLRHGPARIRRRRPRRTTRSVLRLRRGRC